MNIKRILFLLLGMSIAIGIKAEDIIVMRNGDRISAKVLDITQTEIKYKRASRIDGPTYTINQSDVLSINYEDGEQDVFGSVDYNPEESISIDQQPLFDFYNSKIITWTNPESKDAKYTILIYGVNPTSTLADGNIELSCITCIRDNKDNLVGTYDKNRRVWWDNVLLVSLTNRTNSILYLDLGNSFYKRGMNAECMYSPTITSTSSTTSSGVGVNLGSVASAFGIGGNLGRLASGINVGGGSADTNTTISLNKRILPIPPQSSIFLPVMELGSSDVFPWYNNSEIIVEKGALTRGQIVEYSPENSPENYEVIVSYSDQESCPNATTVRAQIYLRGMLGTGWDARLGGLPLDKLSGTEDVPLSAPCRIKYKKQEPYIPIKP